MYVCAYTIDTRALHAHTYTCTESIVRSRESTRGGFSGGGPGNQRGRRRGFGLTHIEVGRGLANIPHQPPTTLSGGEWFVCLFRESGRAAIGKNFIYMIEKCCPAEGRTRPRRRRDEPPHRASLLLLHLRAQHPPPLFRERFYLFSTQASKRARRDS